MTHTSRRVLLLGSTSPIQQALARQLRTHGSNVLEAGRAPRCHGDPVSHPTLSIDARDQSAHQGKIQEAIQILGGLDLVVMAIGALGPEEAYPPALPSWHDTAVTNWLGPASLLAWIAQLTANQPTPCRMIILSSISVEMTKPNQALYAASKAALDRYVRALSCEALHCPTLIIRLGWVDTPMSAGRTVKALTISPDTAASRILRLIQQHRTGIVALPWWWRLIRIIWTITDRTIGIPSILKIRSGTEQQARPALGWTASSTPARLHTKNPSLDDRRPD